MTGALRLKAQRKPCILLFVIYIYTLAELESSRPEDTSIAVDSGSTSKRLCVRFLR